MAKDLYVPVSIRGGRLEAKAMLGQTVIVTEGAETYTGPVTVTPTESEQILQTKDKLLTDNVTVNPIPSEYIIPTGSMEITENGQYDISEKASVTVDVPAPVPTGTIEITENGTYDVAQMATALVNVTPPQNVVTETFIGNGTYSAEVPCPWLPDIIYVYSPDMLDGLNVTAVCNSITTADVYICFRKTKDSATFSANGRLPSQSTFPVIDWSNGVLTVRNPSANGYIFADGGNYTLVGIKLL